jgi:quinohemoprotein ethanol dehydrogenase
VGAHSWQPMSYSPVTGLVYIPTQQAGFFYKSNPKFEQKSLGLNVGIDLVASGMPQDPKVKKAILEGVTGRLVAWDPIQQKQVWSVERPMPWNGGVLSTAGNLTFEGTADGHFEAYRADTGEKIWSFAAQTGVMAGPVSYEAKGEQYIAVLSGWGGVFPLAAGEVALKVGRRPNIGRMLAFKLGASAGLPPKQELEMPELNPPKSTASTATIENGKELYQRYCSMCHGDVAVSGGVLPDLRYSAALSNDQWTDIVLGGLLQPNGMVSFRKELSHKDVEAIRAYVISRANEVKSEGGHSAAK